MPAFAFFFFLFCLYFATKEAWLLVKELSDSPLNEPALHFANFPSFLLALLAAILLFPNRAVSRPTGAHEPRSLAAWQSSLQHLPAGSGWPGSSFAHCPSSPCH